ncbi:hypothetical protein HDU97_003534 [Phlyctochytrium planicorne]|nr:hypothetical protein HDU97_003534 [Phlyctochytrium planicorne]
MQLTINTASDVLSISTSALKTPSPVENKKLNSLQKAAYNGDAKKVRALLCEKKRDINKVDSYHGVTALHIAASGNNVDIAELLLDPTKAVSPKETKKISELTTSPLKKCNIDSLNLEHRTPLSLAVMGGHLDMVSLLLQHGADPDSSDLLGCTPIHYAVLTENLRILSILLKATKKIGAVDRSGLSYLQHAIRLKNIEMTKMILDCGAPIDKGTSEKRRTALHAAAEMGSLEFVKLLISRGADPSLIDIDGKSALAVIDRNHDNQELIDFLTVKMIEKEARSEIGKKQFLGGDESENPWNKPTVPVEETNVEEIEVQSGNRRLKQSAQREFEAEYSKKKPTDQNMVETTEITPLGSLLQAENQPLKLTEEEDSFSENLSELLSDGLEDSEIKTEIAASNVEKPAASERTEESEIESELLDVLGVETEELSSDKQSLSHPIENTKYLGPASAGNKATEESSPLMTISDDLSENDDEYEKESEEGGYQEMLLKESKINNNDDDSMPPSLANEISTPNERLISANISRDPHARESSGKASFDKQSRDSSDRVDEISVEERLDPKLKLPDEREIISTSVKDQVADFESRNKDISEVDDLEFLNSGLIRNQPESLDLIRFSEPHQISSSSPPVFFEEIVNLENSSVCLQRFEELTENLDSSVSELAPMIPLLQRVSLALKDTRENSIDRDLLISTFCSIGILTKSTSDGKNNVDLLDFMKSATAEALRAASDQVDASMQTNLSLQKQMISQSCEYAETLQERDQALGILKKEAADLRLKSAATEATIAELEREKQDLKNLLESAPSEKAMAALVEENKTLKNQLQEASENSLGLEKKLSNISDELKILKMDTTKDEMQISFGRAQNEIRLLKDEISILQSEREKEQATAIEIKTQFENLKAKSIEKSDAEIELQTHLENTRSELSVEIEKKSAFQREAKYLRQLLKGYGASIESLNIQTPDAELSDEEDNENPFKQYCSQLEGDCLELQKRLAHEAEDRATLERQIEEARFHSEEVSDELLELAQALRSEKKNSLALEERLAILQLELENLHNKALQNEKRLVEKESELAKASDLAKSSSEQAEQSQRLQNRLQSEMNAVKTENNSYIVQIEAKNSQIETLRTQLKEMFLKQQTFELELTSKEESAGGGQKKKDLSDEVVQFYEAEIKLISDQLEEEKEIRIAREEEHKKVLASLCDLEEKISDLKALYEKELAAGTALDSVKQKLDADLKSTNTMLQEQAEKAHELEVSLIKLKTRVKEAEDTASDVKAKAEKEANARKDEIEQLKQIIESLEKTKLDQEIQLNSTRLQLEEKSLSIAEADKKIQNLRTEKDESILEIKDLLRGSEDSAEGILSKITDLKSLKIVLKEREKKLETYLTDKLSLEGKLQDTQALFEKRVRELDHQNTSLRSEKNELEIELEKMKSAFKTSKAQYLETQSSLQTALEERDTLGLKLERLSNKLDVEKKKAEKMFKSNDNLKVKLSSFVDLSHEASNSNLNHATSTDIRLNNIKNHQSISCSTVDVSGADPIIALREIKLFAGSEIKSVEGKLIALVDELKRDASKIELLQNELATDSDVESELRQLIVKFLQSQAVRVAEVCSSVNSTKFSLTSVIREIENGIDGAKDVTEKELKKGKIAKEDVDRALTESNTMIEDIKKKRADTQKNLAAALAKADVLEEEKASLQKRIKELTRELQEKSEVHDTYDLQLTEVKQKLTKVETSLQATEFSKTTLQSLLDKVSKEKDSISEKVELLEKEIEKRDKKLKEQRDLAKEAIDEKDRLESQIQSMSAELKSRKGNFEKRDIEFDNVLNETKNENLLLKKSAEKLERSLAEAYETNRTLRASAVENEIAWNKQRADLEAEVLSISQIKSKSEIDKRSAKEAAEESKTRILQLEKAQEYLQQERKDIMSAMDTQESQIKKLKVELEDALGIQRRLELERNSLRDELSRSRIDLRNDIHPENGLSKANWEVERKRLGEELERRTNALAQAERDALTVTRQLQEATTKLCNFQMTSPSSISWQEEKLSFERSLEDERHLRKEAEIRADRIRRQLEEEILSLSTSRKRLEERENFAEHQRRSLDIRIHELQESIENERQMKYKLRDEINTALLTVKNLESENALLKRRADSQESVEVLGAFKNRSLALEDENARLRAKLQNLEATESRAKAAFDEKLRKVANRLEDQSREREKLERYREKAEQELKEKYERRIQKLVFELNSVKSLIDLFGNGVGSYARGDVRTMKDDVLRQMESLKVK